MGLVKPSGRVGPSVKLSVGKGKFDQTVCRSGGIGPTFWQCRVTGQDLSGKG